MEHESPLTREPNMTERVLGAIEESGVTPRPAWFFLLEEWFVWGVVAVSFVLGSIATALTLYITNASFIVEQHLVHSETYDVFEMLPYIWLVLLLLGVGYSVHALHHTRQGYKWPTSALVGIALVLSIVCGTGVYASGLGERIDRYLLANVPLYPPMSGFQSMHWMDPQAGVVVGVVEALTDGGVVLRDIDGTERVVVFTESTVLPPVAMEPGMPLRVMGTTTGVQADTETFEATEVRPFRGRMGDPPAMGHHDEVLRSGPRGAVKAPSSGN